LVVHSFSFVLAFQLERTVFQFERMVMDWVTSERSWTIGNSKGIGVSKLFPITNDLELITRHITYHLEVQEQQCNPPFKRWIKSHVTLFSMDENSYPTSCPNHACMGTEGLEVMLGET